jgi:heterotetrameric sarcosine oxidase gamma subunit
MTALRYPVAIHRLPLHGAFEMRGREPALQRGIAAAGLPWPSRLHQLERGAAGQDLIRLGPTRVLARCPLADEQALADRLAAAFAAEPEADVALVSDMFTGFAVSGSGAGDVLRQGAPLDLSLERFPPGSATGTELWSITAIIIRGPNGDDGFTILVDSAHAGYIDDWLAVASGAPSCLLPGVMSNPPPSLQP